MVIRTDGLLCRILMRMPMWLPFTIVNVRVGADCVSFARIGIR